MSKLDHFDSSGRHTDVDAARGEGPMIETETPAERRLREISEVEHNTTGEACDMGREALALLRGLGTACLNSSEWTRWTAEVRALLARAGEVQP